MTRRQSCGRNQIRVDRKGYRRRAYTTADGTRVAATKVPASRFCIDDRGKPGRGKDIVPELREGKLGGPGYTDRSTKERHEILKRCERKYGYRSCLGSLQYLLTVGKRTMSKKDLKTIAADKKWLEKQYGGEGSFGPRSNPPKGSRRRLNPAEAEATKRRLMRGGGR